MMTAPPRLSFFCPRHQETANATRVDMQVWCEQEHLLSDNLLNDRWEYCCSCQCFVPRQEHAPAHEKCLSCDRQITRRYLCNSCECLSFATALPPKGTLFSILASGQPQPACPCCLTQPDTKVHEHLCEALNATIYTAREKCSCCGEVTAHWKPTPKTTSFIFPASYRRPVAEYLKHLNADAIKVETIPTYPNVLSANADGRFWLFGFKDGYYTILPAQGQFAQSSDYKMIRDLFECERPAQGEVVIVAPAVAEPDPATQQFVLTQKGRLEVLPPPPDTKTNQDVVVAVPPKDNLVAPPDTRIDSKPVVKLSPPLVGGIAAVGLVVLLVGLWFFLPSPKREILAKLKQGQLVAPPGNNAYDVFQKSNLSEGDLQELRQTAVPILTARGQQVIRQLIEDAYNPSVAELGDTARVYEWLDKLDPQNTWKARQQYFQGRQAYEGKNYAGASNGFQQAMKLDPSWALPVNTLARVFMRNKDYGSAQNCYQKAIELEPQWMFPRINLCVLAVEHLKNYGLAEEVCRGVLTLDANKASGHYFLGRALQERGLLCDALSEYRSAQEKAANLADPGFNLGQLNKRVEQLSARIYCP
ncbi:MAG: tetratricopeptide repeat protein [Acidobacteria bacterium]|nr:tetratricopeptide repeat protein [Acidobacteriota bacterium]